MSWMQHAAVTHPTYHIPENREICLLQENASVKVYGGTKSCGGGSAQRISERILFMRPLPQLNDQGGNIAARLERLATSNEREVKYAWSRIF